MNIPYRTQRRLKRWGTVAAVVALVGSVAWVCWAVWLQRYVVYTDDGARLDFDHSANDLVGEVAVEPVAEANIPIFYNEGADAINTSNDLTQLNGYYITASMLRTDLAGVQLQIERLTAGTPVMIDMRSSSGTFYYQTGVSESTVDTTMDISTVAAVVERLESKGFYTIARFNAFQEYNYFYPNQHIESGLGNPSGIGLWLDGDNGAYWLDPASTTATNRIASVVLELRDMGFDEVVLDNFRFPTGNYRYTGDKDAALHSAASTLLAACSSGNFTLSFVVDSPSFPLPDGRCRLYLKNVNAGNIATVVSQAAFEDTDIRLVFLAETADTRYDDYGVLRPVSMAEEVEARKQ